MNEPQAAQPLEILPWEDSFNTGLAEVDEQHQRLVQLLNNLGRQIALDADHVRIDSVFDALRDYALYHFETEEAVWSEYLGGDASEIEHRVVHQNFIDTVNKLIAKQKEESLPHVAESTLDFLVRWLVTHILDSDRELAYTVQNVQAGMSLGEAKARASDQMASFTRVIYATLSSAALRSLREFSRQRRLETALTDAHEETRLAGDALLQQRSLLKNLIQTLPDLVWLKDLKGVYLACNSRVERLIGQTEAQIVGQTDYDIFDRALADSFRSNDRLAMQKGGPSVNEEWVTFAEDNHQELLETTKTPMFDARGELLGVLGIGHDITKRKKNENALKESERRLTNLMANLPGIAYRARDDDCWTFEFISEGCLELTGYEVETLLHNRDLAFADLIHPDDLPQVRAQYEEAVAADNPFKLTYRIVRKDGGIRWVLERGRRLPGKGTKPRMLEGLVIDITSQKIAERSLQQRLALEATLTQVSASLTQSKSEDLASAINEALWRIAQAAECSRSFLMLVDEQSGTFTNEYEWCAEGVEPQREAHQDFPLARFQGTYLRLKQGEIFQISLSETEDYDESIGPLKDFMRIAGDKSLILIPIVSGDRLVGMVGLASEHPDQPWRQADTELWRTLAEIFGAHLLRQEADEKIRHHTWYLENLDKISKVLTEQQDSDQLLHDLTAEVLRIFASDRVWLLHPCDPDTDRYRVPVEATTPQFPGALAKGGEILAGEALTRTIRQQLAGPDPVVTQFHDTAVQPADIREFSIKSQMTARLHLQNGPSWLLGMHQCSYHREWTMQEQGLFKAIAERVSSALSGTLLLNDIRRSERRLLEAEHIAHLGHWELDIASQQGVWSDEIHQIFGTSSRQRAGPELLAQIIHPDDWPKTEASLSACMEDGIEHMAEYRIRRPNGEERWVFCRAERHLDDAGGPGKLVGILQDITERKRVEERLRLSANVIENTAEGVVICDTDGNIVDVNPACCEILGYTRDEVIGRNPSMWQSGRQERDFYRGMWQALNEVGLWRGEVWNRRKDGTLVPEWLTISAVRDPAGTLSHYVGVFSDISQIKQSQDKLDHLAHHDALTDLPNRLLLNERLQHALLRAERHHTELLVLFLDLDRFKHINDSLGHVLGDQLLQAVTGRLKQAVRQDDTIARIGGDEFVLLMEEVTRHQDSVVAAQKILAAFEEPFRLEGHEIRITASLGICIYPRDGADAATLLRNADAAMYRAKEEGRDTYQFYTQELTRNAFERLLLENNLHQAVKNGELRLVYQPQLELKTKRIVGCEALIRWQHPQLGTISPGKFIPIATETGLIHAIGTWVLKTACTQAKDWLERGLDFGRVAINVAGPQIQKGKLLEEVDSILEETNLPPKYLELEVTEGFIMQQAKSAIEQLDQLRRLGVTLSIDDFGTGYSSLSYLKQLPIQKLKIDQSFVRDIPQDPDDMAIATAVIALAKSLGLNVVAEGVETEEQERFLIDAGCKEGQGYLFSKPVSAADVERFFRVCASA